MTSLVYPEGTLCQWCRCEPATSTLYGWATCAICITDKATRIKRWTSKPWVVLPPVKPIAEG